MHGLIRGIAAVVAAFSVGVGAYQGTDWLPEAEPTQQSSPADLFQEFESQVAEQASTTGAAEYDASRLFLETLDVMSKQFEASQSQAEEAVMRLEAIMQGYGKEVRSMQDCSDQNYRTLQSQIEDVNGHVAVLTKQQESLDRLLEEVGSLKSSMSVMNATMLKSGGDQCECKCATADEIADAVAKKLEPMLVTLKQSNGWSRTTSTTTTGEFELNPGEVLTHVNGVPVSQSQPVSVSGYSQPVQQYSGPGVIARTANAGRRFFGQVRSSGTCQQVWNATAGRMETRCN